LMRGCEVRPEHEPVAGVLQWVVLDNENLARALPIEDFFRLILLHLRLQVTQR